MYRGSRTLALVGIPAVAVVAIVVATTMGQGQANPKGALALIFGVIGGFVFLLMIVQGREIGAASSARSTPLTAPGTSIDNPMTVPPVDLWAALAIAPIDDQAARAHKDTWGTVRSSRRSLWVVCVLIFATVPMTFLLETFVPVLIGAALIAAVSVASAVRVLGRGGGLDRAYETFDRSLEPLGMRLDERITVGVTTRGPISPGLKTDIRGAVRFSGERHGRAVAVDMEDGACEVRVATESPAFEAKSRDGRVKAANGVAPAAIEASLEGVPASTSWKGVTVRGDADGILVRRKPFGEVGWMPDLWLAERLADAVGGAPSARG